ncbi:OmpA family protein [Nitrospina watsonii]|uniref:Flagellar motor rotation protein MotB n=1 Tax=Nitrospina watsonii TaxID=1323948 RepID=A0ABM9HEZ0_9BACT|nr:OmpA family protein [Nitrospina watsonii]CAI2718639.1 Flagellar motor rotation protein MotB [Nitrospina watsonii]
MAEKNEKESLQQIKEQLRSRNAQLKKLDAEKARQETRFQHMLTVTGKKISKLQSTVEEQKEQIKFQRGLQQKQVSTTPPSKTPAADKEEASKTDESGIRYEQLAHALKALQKKNRQLTEKVKEERKEHERLAKEKSTLAREVKRLRNDVGHVDEIQSRSVSVQTLTEKSKERFQKLVAEKDGLIQMYEKMIQTNKTGGDAMAITSDMLHKIQEELENTRAEKAELEEEIKIRDRQFEVQMNYEVQRAKERIRKNLKVGRRQRKSISDFSEEVLDERSGQAWLMTFADMFTLLLTYFIILYSLSSVNMNRFKEAILGEEKASIGLLELLDSAEVKQSLDVLTGLKTDNILNEVKNVAQAESLSEVMTISTDQSKVIVKVPSESLFDEGSARLNLERGKEVLDELIRITEKYPYYRININGHTDNVEIPNARFASNWELSSARATSVLRYFLDQNIEPKRLTATGFADTFPIATNKTERGRALNRRVEFVLEKEN